jgi:hypothetical protein
LPVRHHSWKNRRIGSITGSSRQVQPIGTVVAAAGQRYTLATMAKCPECGCELAGMERICRGCFERQYARVTSPKKGLKAEQFVVPAVAVAMFGIMFLLNAIFPAPMAKFGRTLDVTLLVAKLLLAGAVVSWSVWDSMKWRSAQNVLFWTLLGMQVVFAGLGLLHREEEWRWFLLLFLTIAIRKGLTSFYERRAA